MLSRRFLSTTLLTNARSNRKSVLSTPIESTNSIHVESTLSSSDTISTTIDVTDTTTSKDTSQLKDWFEGRAKTPKWMQSKITSINRAQGTDTPSTLQSQHENTHLASIIQTLQQNKGINIKTIDMSDKSEIIDYLVIVTGKNQKHIYALADSVRILFKKTYQPSTFMPDTLTIDGSETEWMTLDTGRVVVHCFSETERQEYNLEGLWESVRDPVIKDAKLGFVNKQETAERIIKDCKEGMENQFKLSLTRLEVGDLINEEEVKNAMK